MKKFFQRLANIKRRSSNAFVKRPGGARKGVRDDLAHPDAFGAGGGDYLPTRVLVDINKNRSQTEVA
jgi:hypothetical protein